MPIKDFGSEGLLAFWNSLTDDQRNELIKNLESFHALVGSLKNRGIIETDRNMSVINVLRADTDVDVLKLLHAKINPPGIKIIDSYDKSKKTE
jgi:hypothetical protein